MTDCIICIAKSDLNEAETLLQTIATDGYALEDYSSLEEEVEQIAHVDLIDQALLSKDRSQVKFHLYMDNAHALQERMRQIKETFSAHQILFSIQTQEIKSDYQNSWKKYYHPMAVGEKLFLCPEWEDVEPPEGRIKVILQPGMAFGTGMHETTQLCLQLLEKTLRSGDSVLDIGCGSGILAISAKLLGAGKTIGTDLDPLAIQAAKENSMKNHCEIIWEEKNFAEGVDGPFRLVCSNLVADAVMEIAGEVNALLDSHGRWISSGILSSRADEVKRSLQRAGFHLLEKLQKKDWVAFLFEK